MIVKADPLGAGIEIFAGLECVAHHVRGARGARVIVEAHVADLRQPRFERLRARAERTAVNAAPLQTRSLVPWPGATVEQRDIADYVAAVGGVR